MMTMSTEQLEERELAGETEVLGESLSKGHFVHQNPHVTSAGIDPGPSLWEAGD
jgi:hypothetical protein